MEENVRQDPTAQAEEPLPVLGKFKNVDALARAYSELEAEFTRRSQRLKTLEETLAAPREEGKTETSQRAVMDGEELYRAVTENEGVRARVLGDYLASLKGVPLMTGAGAGVSAPVKKPASISEAGKLALGYLRTENKS